MPSTGLLALGLTLVGNTARERETMSQLDTLLLPRQGKPCKVGRILGELDEPYKSALAELLADHDGMPDEPLRQLMKRAGLNVSYSSVYRHRREFCNCESVGIV